MKQEYIVAFLVKNENFFTPSELPVVKQLLAEVDDDYFPLLMKKKFVHPVSLTIIGVLLCIGSIPFIFGCYFNLEEGLRAFNYYGKYYMDDFMGAAALFLLAILLIGFGVYLIFFAPKDKNISTLKAIAGL